MAETIAPPVGDAYQAILHADPVLGGIVIIQLAAIIFLTAWVINKDRALHEKDRKIEEANAKVVEVLERVIPAIRDIKELAIDLSIHRQGRR